MDRVRDPFERAERRLVDAYWRRLRDAGASQPEALARELVGIARHGHHWRPVEALHQPTSPQPGNGSGHPPEEFRELRAALDTRPLCVCGTGVLEHELVGGRRAGCQTTACPTYSPTPERSC